MQAAQATKVRAKLTARTFIWLQGLSGLIGFAALLEIVPRIGIVSPDYLPPFSAIAMRAPSTWRAPVSPRNWVTSS